MTPRPPHTARRAAAALRHRAPFAGSLARTFGQLVLRGTAGALAGTALAVAALLLDAAIGWSLPFAPQRVRDLLITLTGASLTIAVFALWMRSIVVSLVAQVFHARTLASFLDDRFQRAIAGWMVAAFAVLVSVAVASPSTDDGGVPPTATLLAYATIVAALLAILLAVRQAAERLDTSELIHQLADRGFRILERTERIADDPVPAAAGETVRDIDADALGWVRAVDRYAIVARLPVGATATLRVATGSFVSPGSPLLGLDVPVDEATADGLRAAIDIGRARDPEADLGSSLEELTDIAEHAAGPGKDSATAREALRYLEALLGRVLERGLPTGHLVVDDRALIATRDPTVAEHLGRAVERLFDRGTDDPATERLKADLLRRLRDRATALGDQDALDALERAVDGSSAAAHPRTLPDDEDGRTGATDGAR